MSENGTSVVKIYGYFYFDDDYSLLPWFIIIT